MRIKKVEKESEEEKNYKLLLHSKIFSGGFEDRFLNQFSKRTIKKLQELTEITKDESLYKNFSSDGICTNEKPYAFTKEDETLVSILHFNKDKLVDKFIEFL
jgi:hypothetical protein